MNKRSYAQRMKGKTGLRRIIRALHYSWDGFQTACKEQGFRQLLWIHGTLLLLLVLLPFGIPTKMVLLAVSFVSLIVELLNTAVEAAVDHTSTARHPLAKQAKDLGSAAQILSLVMLVVLWLMALWREYG
ncbi:diacylglycerol kinase [Neisseria leonii]|uniref:diacylglycerol kinase n=1 Tax=Neisseria leonii TaxID=2995413 RepID=UPI0030CC3C67